MLAVCIPSSTSNLKDKSQSSTRWLILLFACLMMIGNYYSYDIPAALHVQLEDYMGKPNNYETLFSLLYTVYSVPNCFLPFFGGYFVDRFGYRTCLLVFASFICAGQVVFAFGVSIKSWPVMFLGRVLFGFGGESLGVGNGALLSSWFKGKELAFAFGLNLSIARLGSVINNLVSPALAISSNVQFAVYFGAILCAGSILSVVFISSLDKAVESAIHSGGGTHTQLSMQDDVEEEINFKKPLTGGSNSSSSSSAVGDDFNAVAPVDGGGSTSLMSVFSFPQGFWILVISCVVVYGCVLPFNNIASSLLLERSFFITNPADCSLAIPTQCQSNSNTPGANCPSTNSYYQPPLPLNYTFNGVYYNTPLTGDLIDCSDSMWTASDSCGYYYCNQLEKGEMEAATIMSIPYIISACLSPLLGGIVDRVGYRAFVATISPAVLIIVHLFLGLSTVSPIGPLVGQGLAYSGFAAVLWPSVPLVVEEKFIGLGFGLTTAIQNGGLALFPIIIATIYKSAGDSYIPKVEYFFVSLAALGVLVGIYLNFYDYYYNNSVLNRSGTAPSVETGTLSRSNSISGPTLSVNTLAQEEGVKLFAKANSN